MPIISLPDGRQLNFEQAVSVLDVAQSIGSGLAKAALAGKIEGKLLDTNTLIQHDASLTIVTDQDTEGLEIIRHSTAHLMAHAVLDLFPKAQVTIGPVIADGFYYDFAWEAGFTPADLERIEARMQELAKADIPIERRVVSREEAIKLFRDMGETYKVELVQAIPEGEEISLYQQGDFVDVCRGPHVPSTGRLKAFKLMKLAGAYWRGDSNNAMLQRIYGTAFANKKELNRYLLRLEEAKKRDHRKIGKELDLFHMQEEAPGMAFWHGKGWRLFQTVIQYMRKKLYEYDYQEVNAPLIMDKILWERSGHWEKFGADGMFATHSENRDYVIKPMNCVGHLQIFNQGLKSYRDLPLRLAEFGLCHRNEFSGTLHGLLRIRQFTQDDAHVLCSEDQLDSEIKKLIDFTYEVYEHFGFRDIVVRLATRPEKRIGSDAIWDISERALADALRAKNLEFDVAPGEGAFYGPKIEFHLRDCLDRMWQCGTIQADFSMPERLGAQYVDTHGERKVPIMIHRAILGSMERFIGIVLEHYAGKLPFWLAPEQVAVLNIADRHADYAGEIAKTLRKHEIRSILDLRNEKIGFKIREQTLQKVPYLVVIGDKELETQTISVRTQGGKDLGAMTVDAFLMFLQAADENAAYEQT